MAVLVDQIFEMEGPRGYKRWCHMGTDDHTDAGLAELHGMAQRIGLKRAWFQNEPRLPHYDLTPSRRALAVRYGAQEVDAQELVERIRRTA